MSSPPITYSGPVISSEVPWETRRHLQLIYQKLGNHVQGISLLSDKVNTLKAGSTATVFEGAGGGGSTSGVVGVAVNNQIGQTAYSTMSGDNNALIVFSDASPIAVTLNSQTPPWSCFIANIGALGAGTVTLTPFSGTINGGATLAVLPTYEALVAFDGTNWFAATLPIVPLNFGAISHEFLNAYNATTGAFTARAITESDLPASSQVGVFGATIAASDVGNPQFVTVPYNCTISGWTIMADASGSASVDVWFIAGSAPPTAPNIPTSGNKISASAPIATSTAQSAAGGATAISTWTTALTIWGTLAFNLSSITTSTKVTIQIQVQRS